MDREQVSRLLGRKIIVGLNAAGVGGVEVAGTLDEMGDDGVLLSDTSELGPGPKVFCPWRTFRSDPDRPAWFMPPSEGSETGEQLQVREVYDVGDVIPEEIDPEPPAGRFREPSARTLERVVPIARKRTVGEVTVALTSLELYGEGLGVLRWRASMERGAVLREPGFGFGIPGPEFEIRDDTGRALPWSPRGSGSSDGESDGEVEVQDLPEAGGLEVVVPRLVADAYAHGEYRGEGPSYEGPWSFRFSI